MSKPINRPRSKWCQNKAWRKLLQRLPTSHVDEAWGRSKEGQSLRNNYRLRHLHLPRLILFIPILLSIIICPVKRTRWHARTRQSMTPTEITQSQQRTVRKKSNSWRKEQPPLSEIPVVNRNNAVPTCSISQPCQSKRVYCEEKILSTAQMRYHARMELVSTASRACSSS